ncbi:DUF4190 domain-containing protein [Jonesiaceae bacterium BS-20]|uniref:DUF4190 domain-containing protein n=1 Tax=Jonesiaceae bacterium BS-20 TaxID=3120821 RepID=A0AAU7DT61_9MICO
MSSNDEFNPFSNTQRATPKEPSVLFPTPDSPTPSSPTPAGSAFAAGTYLPGQTQSSDSTLASDSSATPVNPYGSSTHGAATIDNSSYGLTTPSGAISAPGSNPYAVPTASGNPYESPTSGTNPYGTPAPGTNPYGQPMGNPGHPSIPAYGGPQSASYNGGYRQGPAGTNSMATAALVCGILGVTIFMFIGPILALVLGISAKNQIRRTGEEGGGLATAGIVLGALGIAFSVLVIIFVLLLSLPAIM